MSTYFGKIPFTEFIDFLKYLFWLISPKIPIELFTQGCFTLNIKRIAHFCR